MLPQIKYNKVNWQDGMKISRNHFVQMENSMMEQIRDMTATYMTNNNYGLLTPSPNSKHSLDIQLFHDGSEQITVKVLECRAITPGGSRIEIIPGSQPVEAVILKENLKTQAYEIYLNVNPFQRIASGQPDPLESPLRQPDALSTYKLEILPYPQTHKPEYGAFHLCIGRLEIEAESVKLSDHYIPSCIFLLSHPRLVAAHQKLVIQLGELEVSLTGIVQRIYGKDQLTILDKSLLLLAQSISGYINYSMDTFKHITVQQSPVHMVIYFLSFARTINTTLNGMVRKHKEELLEYFHKWFELSPREMENQLRTMLGISYDHSDTFNSLHKTEFFVNSLVVLFRKLNELNYIQQPVQQEKVYGWLAVHTENRRENLYKISSTSIIIGRTEGEYNDVDFSIQDDTWVSRRHVKITVKEERGELMYCLTDLKSNNGTYIHDTQTKLKPDEEFVIMDGDTFQIGKTNIIFRSAESITTEKDLRDQLNEVRLFKILNFGELIEQ